MFEFNREFIINNNVGPLTVGTDKGKRFGYDATAKVLKVGKMINIEAAKVHSIHRAPYYPEVCESVKLDAAGLDGTLVITISQEGRIISLVSDRLAHHTKDYIFNGNPDQWQAQFERQAAMEDMDRLIDVTVSGTDLLIEAKDCYTRIDKVVFDGATTKTWTRVGEFKTALKGNWATDDFIPGTEGMGTVTRILKNMRLQTNAHLSAHGFDMDERPLPGGKYEQWTIQYVSERRHQSGEVFGSINHSLVTLIFFIEKDVVSEWAAVIGTKDTTGTLAKDAGLDVCPIAQPVTSEAVVDVDGDDTPDDILPGSQSAPNASQEIEAKEPVVTSVKKHKA